MATFNWPSISVSSTPDGIQFKVDGVNTYVNKDTATPSNSTPLPVKALDDSGNTVDFATEGTLASVEANTAAIDSSTGSIDSKTPSLGQALMAASVPVAIASNQSAVPISAASLPLPAGAATEATLSSIDTKLTSPIAVTGPLTDTQLRASAVPVSVASLPLPTGAATEATLLSIDSKLTSPLSVTGPLTDTQLRATPVPVSLTSTTITGSVAVTGPLTDTELRASAVPISAASLPLPSGAATETTLAGLHYTQGSTTSGQSGPLMQAAVTSSSPTYVAGQTSPLSITTTGNLRVTANINGFSSSALGQKTMANSMAVVIASDQTFLHFGSVGGGTSGTQSALAGGVYSPTPPSLTGGQQAALQLTSAGELKVSGTFSATTALPSAFTTSKVTLSAATATSVIATNASRKKLLVQNISGGDVWFGGSSVSNTGSNTGIKVADGGSYQFDNTAQLYAYSVAGGDVVYIEET